MRPLIRFYSSLLVLAGCLSANSCSFRKPPVKPSRFDQNKAYSRLVELCSLGPRNNGSEGKTRAEHWIQQSLQNAGVEVTLHDFEYTGEGSQVIKFRNIVGRLNPKEPRRVLLGTHYDTRSKADRDPDESRRGQPIIGANDGASGVAVLLELAALWKDRPPAVGVDFIFFDGEDFGSKDDLSDYFLGSKAYVRDYPDYRPEWGVVLDMVGDGDLRITKERFSLAQAPAVVERLWNAARRVGADGLVEQVGGRVYDDHSAFLDHGLLVVLLIDFHYQWFHTTGDTPDKCSPDSLGQVGRTVMEAVEAER